MRTPLDRASDGLDAAKALADSRGVSARAPMGSRNGFPVVALDPGTPGFGVEEVAAAASERTAQRLGNSSRHAASDVDASECAYGFGLAEPRVRTLVRREFYTVKDQLAMLHNRRKIDDQDLNRPRLRKAPGSGGTIDENCGKGGSGKTDDSGDGPP